MSVLAPGLPAWESQLLPFNGGSGQYEEATVNFSGRDWRLLDFSYSGYKLGAQPLATGVPCTVFNVAGSGDITAALQTAINSAQTAGGVVRIPAGTFTLSAPLYITGSNVSIEGAGSNATFIQVPSSYTQADPRYEGLFTFGKAAAGWNKGWIDRGTVLTDVTALVPEGQMYVDVLDASGIAVNDWVVVRQYFWPNLSNLNSNNTWASYSGWPVPTTGANRSFSFTYLRQVLSKAGNRLNLDAPIPWRLDPANNPIKVQQVPPTGGFAMKQNVGLSGLSISFDDNYNDTSFSPARPAGAAVHFEGVRDGWIYDVVVRNFPRFAIQAESSARLTVLDSAVYDCQDFGGDGYGYAYHWNESQQILVKRSYAEMVRHAYICQHPLTNLMVLTQNTSREARLGDDSHHSFVHGYLFDQHQSFEGSGARTTERGSTSSNAYETGGSSVFWNFQGDQGRGGGADGGAIFMNPSFDGWGMVIGGPGGAYKVFDGNTNAGDLISPAAGLQVGPTLQAAAEGSKDQNALYEGIGQAGLSPASLYETQLLRRLGSLPADFASTCSAAFSQAPVVPSLYPGPETLVFNSDHLGWVPQLGSGCDPSSTAAGGTKTLQCWADSDGQNHSPGGAEAAWATVNGTDYSILMDFTGPSQARSSYSTLSFWAYSSVAGLQLRLYIAQRQDGNYTDSNAANTLISVPAANTWTQVSVPMSTFGSPATLFNKIQFRSYSTNAGATVYVDDILLSGGATPTPSLTPTRTPTATRSPTRTSTSTVTWTLTPPSTPSPSATATLSATVLASATATPTGTASPSPSRTVTPSAQLTVVSSTLLPATVCAGQPLTLVFTVQNVGSGSASNVSITSVVKVGTGNSGPVGPSSPASATLLAGASQSFTFSVNSATGAGGQPWSLAYVGFPAAWDDNSGQPILEAAHSSPVVSVFACTPTPSPSPSSSPSATETPTPAESPTATPTFSASPSATPSPTAICPGGSFMGDAGITGVIDTSGVIDGNRYNLPSAGLLSAMQFYVGSGTGQARLAVYADASGAPGALLADSGDLVVQPGVNSAPFPMTPLAAGVYWLFIQVTPGVTIGYRPSGGQEYYQNFTFGAFPPTLSGGSFDTWTMGLLAVICPAPTPTPTPSFTESPVFSATPTATESPLFTDTPSPTATPSMSESPSPSYSSTPSSSPTVSPSASTTDTGTLSATPSPTPSATAAVFSVTVSPSPTGTPTGSVTEVPTMSVSPSATPSVTFSTTSSATFSVTYSVTPSATLSISPSPPATMTLTATPTASPSPLPTVSASPTAPVQGPLQILEAVPFPNPNPRELRIKLAGPAEALELRVYSPAMTLLWAAESGPLPGGWSTVPFSQALPLGISFAQLSARQGGQHSLPTKPLRLVRIP